MLLLFTTSTGKISVTWQSTAYLREHSVHCTICDLVTKPPRTFCNAVKRFFIKTSMFSHPNLWARILGSIYCHKY